MKNELFGDIIKSLEEAIDIIKGTKKPNRDIVCKKCFTSMIGIRRQNGYTWVCHTCDNNFTEEIRKPD